MLPFCVFFSSIDGCGIFRTAAHRRWIPVLKIGLLILCLLALLLIPCLPLVAPQLPPFSVLSVGCLLSAALAGTALLMHRVLEKEYYGAIDEVQREYDEVGHPLTAEQADTAVKIRRLQTLAQPEPTNGRWGQLSVGRVRTVYADDFFQLHKWLYELQWAKRNGQTAEVLDRLQAEMEARTRLYRLPADKERRYEELARVEAERDCELHSR
ncbi:hypothetical protein M3Y99_01054700 [Aphelenchoides fujianensis]|nr:hypothetical protein M3Y99_01054700 [Aphelenchoides fujianensis]